MHTFPPAADTAVRRFCYAHFIHPHDDSIHHSHRRHPPYGKAPAGRDGTDGVRGHDAAGKPRGRSDAGDGDPASVGAHSDSGRFVDGASAVRSGLSQRRRAKASLRQARHSDGKRQALAGEPQKDAHHAGRAHRVSAHRRRYRSCQRQICDFRDERSGERASLCKV